MKKTTRESDLFARLGGDEFCIILKDCPKEVAYSKMYWISPMRKISALALYGFRLNTVRWT